MNYYYEQVCIEAGIEAQEIRKVRRIFEADRKRLKKENQIMEEMGYIHFSIDSDDNEREESFCIPDDSCNVEEEAINNVDMEKLLQLLAELDPIERDTIRNYYDKSVNFSAYAREIGVSRDSLNRIAKRILKDLKEKFGVND